MPQGNFSSFLKISGAIVIAWIDFINPMQDRVAIKTRIFMFLCIPCWWVGFLSYGWFERILFCKLFNCAVQSAQKLWLLVTLLLGPSSMVVESEYLLLEGSLYLYLSGVSFDPWSDFHVFHSLGFRYLQDFPTS